jgi:hypothetical protein
MAASGVVGLPAATFAALVPTPARTGVAFPAVSALAVSSLTVASVETATRLLVSEIIHLVTSKFVFDPSKIYLKREQSRYILDYFKTSELSSNEGGGAAQPFSAKGCRSRTRLFRRSSTTWV